MSSCRSSCRRRTARPASRCAPPARARVASPSPPPSPSVWSSAAASARARTTCWRGSVTSWRRAPARAPSCSASSTGRAASSPARRASSAIRTWRAFLNQGGMQLLGRTADVIRTTQHFEKAEASCEKLKLDALVLIGGAVSNSDTAALAEHFAAGEVATRVIGVPASIDGDLLVHSEGSIGLRHGVSACTRRSWATWRRTRRRRASTGTLCGSWGDRRRTSRWRAPT